ncbi:MAG: hypothetical protein ACREC5_01620 [Thermoplasmata archaeon]
MVRPPDLRGAFGVARPPLSLAGYAHPERALRFLRIQQSLWLLRVGIVASVLALILLARGLLP